MYNGNKEKIYFWTMGGDGEFGIFEQKILIKSESQ